MPYQPPITLNPPPGRPQAPVFSRTQSSSSTPSQTPSPSAIDVIEPIFPLQEALSVPPYSRDKRTSYSRHLPELVATTLSLSLSKACVRIALAERLVFIRPAGTSDASSLDPEMANRSVDGRDGRVSGFVNVVCPVRRLARFIRVRVRGVQRLAFSSGLSWEDDEVFRREVQIDCGSEGLWLERGVSTFEFALAIPCDSPVSDRSPCGRVQYLVEAVVSGSGGFFSSDLTDSKELAVIMNPLEDSSQHMQFSVRQEGLSPHLGIFALSLLCDAFIICAPLHLTFSLVAPSPSLTIFAISVYIRQSTFLQSVRDVRRKEDVVGRKQFIIQEGKTAGCATKGFAERSRALGQLVLDGRSWGASGEERDELWQWTRTGRIPNDDNIRPTTMPGTQTSLRFSCQLVVEIVFNHSTVKKDGTIEEGQVQIATVYNKAVNLASCCCSSPRLALPVYSAQAPVVQKAHTRDVNGIGCNCDLASDKLEQPEIELMRNRGAVLEGEELRLRRRGDERPADGLMGLVGGEARVREGSPSKGEGGVKVGETFKVGVVPV